MTERAQTVNGSPLARSPVQGVAGSARRWVCPPRGCPPHSVQRRPCRTAQVPGRSVIRSLSGAPRLTRRRRSQSRPRFDRADRGCYKMRRHIDGGQFRALARGSARAGAQGNTEVEEQSRWRWASRHWYASRSQTVNPSEGPGHASGPSSCQVRPAHPDPAPLAGSRLTTPDSTWSRRSGSNRRPTAYKVAAQQRSCCPPAHGLYERVAGLHTACTASANSHHI
jgi:hypothetical protein